MSHITSLSSHCNIFLTIFSLDVPYLVRGQNSLEKNYDQPRQHIKKQRHYFADEGPSSQNYGFASSHV